MILSDRDIKKALREGRIKIKPSPNLKRQLGTASLDLRLGREFRYFNHTRKAFIDVKDSHSFQDSTTLTRVKKDQYFVVQPNEFVLGVTLEYIELPDDLAARIDGRSSLGRLGIVIHSTAGHVDAGFRGHLTLEMSNIGKMPVYLYPGIKICQLVFETLSSPSQVPYWKKPEAKYLDAAFPEESKIGGEK